VLIQFKNNLSDKLGSSLCNSSSLSQLIFSSSCLNLLLWKLEKFLFRTLFSGSWFLSEEGMIRNWSRWSDIGAVMLPAMLVSHISLKNILSIRVCDLGIILILIWDVQMFYIFDLNTEYDKTIKQQWISWNYGIMKSKLVKNEWN